MKLEVDAVLFDSDGVLVDSHDQVQAAWTQLSLEYELDVEMILAEMVGLRATDTLERHLAGDVAERAVARLEDIEIGLARSTRPLPGAVELLARLPSCSWTIVTSASRRLAVARWRSAGIRIPDHVVTADDVSSGKPHPEPFLRAAGLLGIEPARCIVFEDSPSGGKAAKAAGTEVVAVGPHPWRTQPDGRVRDLSQVTVEEGPSTFKIRLELAGSDTD